MLLYDNESSVDWFYDGAKTKEQMQADAKYSGMFDAPAVLYDNGAGKVYSWESLEDVCARYYVRYTSPQSSFDELQKVFGSGRYLSDDVEDLQQGVVEAKEAAEEAKQIAESGGGADPQLQALARMQVMTMDFTETTSTNCVGFRDYWPEWAPDTEYAYQQPLQYEGKYYRASKALTSSSVYPPDTAGESEYYPIEVAPDGVIVYRECHGQYDQVLAGETRHYPDAEGPVYRAKVDTAYDPDTVPDNWELES